MCSQANSESWQPTQSRISDLINDQRNGQCGSNGSNILMLLSKYFILKMSQEWSWFKILSLNF